MGEGDLRVVSAGLPGAVLHATGIQLPIATYLCCVTQVRALRRAAAKAPLPRRGARGPQGVGKPVDAAPSKASRACILSAVRGERVYRAFLPITAPSRGLSDNVVLKPQSGGRPSTMLANDKYS